MTSTSHAYRCPIGVLFGRALDSDPGRNVKAYLGNSTIVSVIPRTGGLCKIGIPVEKSEVVEWRNASEADLIQRLKNIAPCLKLEGLKFADVYPPVYLTTKQWVNQNVVLFGDACHAMHPARSQGMNITIRCIDAFVRLFERYGIGDPQALLREYQDATKPLIDVVLKDNHQKGLEFESMDEASYLTLQDTLRAIQGNKDIRIAYSMNAAGY